MSSFTGVSFGFLSIQDKDTKSIPHTKSNSQVKLHKARPSYPEGDAPKIGRAGEGNLSIHNSCGDMSVHEAVAMFAYKGFYIALLGT